MRTAALMWAFVAVAGCKKPDRATQCKELVSQTKRIAEGLASGLGADVSKDDLADLDKEMAELEQQCLTWPPEVFACMQLGADQESPTCQAALAHVTGVASGNVDKAPAGPPVAGTATLPKPSFDGYRAVLTADGSLAVLDDKGITAPAMTGDTPRWHKELNHGDWLLALPDGGLLVGDDDAKAVLALDPATGNVRWQIEIPRARDDDYDHRAEAAVHVADGVLLAIGNGRFLKLDPAACASSKSPAGDAKPARPGKAAKPAPVKPPACLTTAFELPDETIDDPELLALSDGSIVLGESGLIRYLSPTGETLAAIHVRDSLGGIGHAGPTRIAVAMDDELVIFELAGCPRDKKVELSRKRGRLYIRGEGDCEDCVQAPPTCLVARTELKDVDAHPPLVLGDGAIVVTTDDGIAKVSPDGKKQWVTDVPAFGSIRETSAGLVALTSTVGDDLDAAPTRVVAIDPASGQVRWQRELPTTRSGLIVSGSDAIVEANGTWIAAGYKEAVAWVKLGT